MRDQFTFDASVGGAQIALEVLRARRVPVQQSVWNRDLTGPPSGAERMRDVNDIISTTDVAVVLLDTATQVHPTVVSGGH